MSITAEGARRELLERIGVALEHDDVSAAEIVELIIRTGWQPRPVPDPNSDHLTGRLRDGTHVPIEIRHSMFSRVG